MQESYEHIIKIKDFVLKFFSVWYILNKNTNKEVSFMNLCVYGASSDKIDKVYIKTVEKMGLEMAKRGHGLVFGGGAEGLMGAAARGMSAGGGKIIGVAPSFFEVD